MQTPNVTSLGLNQWNPADPINTSQFNEDNRIIDQEVSTLKTNASTLEDDIAALASDIASLESALPNKLDKTSTSSQSLSGPVVAGGTQALGTAQVRNVIMSTTDLTAGSSPLAMGTIYLFYEV